VKESRTRRFCPSNLRFAMIALSSGLSFACGSPDRPELKGVADAVRSSSAYAIEAGIPTVRVTDTLSQCSSCKLTAEVVGELRDIPSELAWQDLPIVRRTSNGQLLAMVPDREFVGIYVFDSLGRFERTVGRRGPGPGELWNPISFVVDAADTIHVLDSGRRISVLTLDGKGIRDVRTTVTINSESGLSQAYIPRPDGSIIASASSAAPNFAGIPLYALSNHGEIEKAFGTPNLSSMGAHTARILSAGVEIGRVWVAEPTNYRLEEVRVSDGSVTRIIAIAAPWFDKSPIMTKSESDVRFAESRIQVVKMDLKSRPTKVSIPPRTALRGMQLSSGKLWLLWQLPAPRWDTVGTKYPFPEEMRLSSELNDRMWITAVDVVDVDQGKLLARQYFPFHAHLIAPEFMGHSYYTKSGEPRVDVWRLFINAHGVSATLTR